MTNIFRLLALATLAALSIYTAEAKDIFVSPTGNDSNSGATSALALRTIAAAGAKAAPGDIVQIASGRYQEAIVPTRSGAAGMPITYKRYGSAPVVLTHGSTEGLKTAIDLAKVNYLVFDGIDVDGVKPGPNATVKYFATIADSNNIVIRNCHFKYANGYYGVWASGTTSYLTIEDCTIDWNGLYNDGNTGNSDWGDLVNFDASVHHVLVQRSKLLHGPHDVILIRSSYTIIQDNILDNDYSDVLGGDLGGRPGAMVGSNNVFQRNYFVNAGQSSDAPTNSFTKFEGTLNIARYNVFAYGNQEGLQADAAEWSPICFENRMYNNTFYKLGAGAWRTSWYDGGSKTGNNKFVNNLVVDSRMSPYKASFDNDFTIAVKAYNNGDLAGNQAISNMFSPAGGKAPVVFIYDTPGNIDIATAEARYPGQIKGNLWKKPVFVSSNPQKIEDFDLQPGSPGIDQGAFLTTTSTAGTSNRIPVADTRFFIDGFGLIPGDLIRLQGTSTTARIVAVDHAAKTLQLATSVTFTNGQGIALDYDGSAPDIGGGEWDDGTDTTRPGVPLSLTAQ